LISRKHMKNFMVVSLAFLFLTSATFALEIRKISASEASNHVGETATVCGEVASANYATRSRGKPTFLNLDKPYPNHIFTAVIFDDLRSSFDYAPESLTGENICVTGYIERYKGKPFSRGLIPYFT
jgi:hypothetical protein